MEKVKKWLTALEMDEYAPAFQKAGFDRMSAIRIMKRDDLRQCGITAAGHLAVFEDAIAQLLQTLPIQVMFNAISINSLLLNAECNVDQLLTSANSTTQLPPTAAAGTGTANSDIKWSQNEVHQLRLLGAFGRFVSRGVAFTTLVDQLKAFIRARPPPPAITNTGGAKPAVPSYHSVCTAYYAQHASPSNAYYFVNDPSFKKRMAKSGDWKESDYPTVAALYMQFPLRSSVDWDVTAICGLLRECKYFATAAVSQPLFDSKCVTPLPNTGSAVTATVFDALREARNKVAHSEPISEAFMVAAFENLKTYVSIMGGDAKAIAELKGFETVDIRTINFSQIQTEVQSLHDEMLLGFDRTNRDISAINSQLTGIGSLLKTLVKSFPSEQTISDGFRILNERWAHVTPIIERTSHGVDQLIARSVSTATSENVSDAVVTLRQVIANSSLSAATTNRTPTAADFEPLLSSGVANLLLVTSMPGTDSKSRIANANAFAVIGDIPWTLVLDLDVHHGHELSLAVNAARQDIVGVRIIDANAFQGLPGDEKLFGQLGKGTPWVRLTSDRRGVTSKEEWYNDCGTRRTHWYFHPALCDELMLHRSLPCSLQAFKRYLNSNMVFKEVRLTCLYLSNDPEWMDTVVVDSILQIKTEVLQNFSQLVVVLGIPSGLSVANVGHLRSFLDIQPAECSADRLCAMLEASANKVKQKAAQRYVIPARHANAKQAETSRQRDSVPISLDKAQSYHAIATIIYQDGLNIIEPQRPHKPVRFYPLPGDTKDEKYRTSTVDHSARVTNASPALRTVAHSNQPAIETDDEPLRRFLAGGLISWKGLTDHHDCARSLLCDPKVQEPPLASDRIDLHRFMRVIRSKLDSNHTRASRDTLRVNVISLYHSRRAGATTFCRRVLWELRSEYPCVILSNPDAEVVEIVKMLSHLSSISGLGILVLVDSTDWSERALDVIFSQTSQHNLVFIQTMTDLSIQKDRIYQIPIATSGGMAASLAAGMDVKHSNTGVTADNTARLRLAELLAGKKNHFFLDHQLSDDERSAFQVQYSRFIVEMKATSKIQRANRTVSADTPFLFGLCVFLREYQVLGDFLSEHMKVLELDPIGRQLLKLLTFVNYYSNSDTGLDPILINGIINKSTDPKSWKPVILSAPTKLLEERSRLAILALLIQSDGRPYTYKPAFDVIAEALLPQLVQPDPALRESWMHLLPNLCIEFIDCMASSGRPDVCEALLTSVFVQTANQRMIHDGRSPRKSATQQIDSRFVTVIRDAIYGQGGETTSLSDINRVYRPVDDIWARLCAAFPKCAHYFHHRGRFRSHKMRDHKTAIELLDQAIELNRNEMYNQFRFQLSTTKGSIYSTRLRHLFDDITKEFKTPPRAEESKYREILEIVSSSFRAGWDVFEKAGEEFRQPPTADFAKACGRQVRLSIRAANVIKWLCWKPAKDPDIVRMYTRIGAEFTYLQNLLENAHSKLQQVELALASGYYEISSDALIHDTPEKLSDDLFACEGRLGDALESADDDCKRPDLRDPLLSRVRFTRIFWKLNSSVLNTVEKPLLQRFYERLCDIVDPNKFESKTSTSNGQAPYDSFYMYMLLASLRAMDRRRMLDKQNTVLLAAKFVRQWVSDHPTNQFARMYNCIFLFRWPTEPAVYKMWEPLFAGVQVAQGAIHACAEGLKFPGQRSRTYEWIGRHVVDPYTKRPLQLLAAASDLPSDSSEGEWMVQDARKHCARLSGLVLEVSASGDRGVIQVNGLDLFFMPGKCEPPLTRLDMKKPCRCFVSFTLRGPVARDVVMETNADRLKEEEKVLLLRTSPPPVPLPNRYRGTVWNLLTAGGGFIRPFMNGEPDLWFGDDNVQDENYYPGEGDIVEYSVKKQAGAHAHKLNATEIALIIAFDSNSIDAEYYNAEDRKSTTPTTPATAAAGTAAAASASSDSKATGNRSSNRDSKHQLRGRGGRGRGKSRGK